MGKRTARVLELFLRHAQQQGVTDVTDVTPASVTHCVTLFGPKIVPSTPVTSVTYVAGVMLAPFAGALAAVERECPAGVAPGRWQQCLLDARAFLAQWDEQALALGWTDAALFGLPEPVGPLHSGHDRLERYDATGLLWLLRGRPVVALTEVTAAIQDATGVMVYRRFNKPALGPLGDSLDDFA
jgi:hypothetical protein